MSDQDPMKDESPAAPVDAVPQVEADVAAVEPEEPKGEKGHLNEFEPGFNPSLADEAGLIEQTDNGPRDDDDPMPDQSPTPETNDEG